MTVPLLPGSGYTTRKPGPEVRLDRDSPSARDLRLNYMFLEGAGDTAYDLVHGLPAAVVAPVRPIWGVGRYQAATFRAQSGGTRLAVANDPIYKPTQAITVMAWIYPFGGFSNYNYVASIDYRNDGSWTAPFVAYNLQYAVGTTLTPQFNVLGTGATSGAAIPTLAWTHLCGTYDGATITLLVNGFPVATHAVTGAIPYGNNGPLCIGDVSTRNPLPTSSCSLNGLIEDFRVYGRALPPDEVRWIMRNPLAHLVAPGSVYPVVAVDTTSPNLARIMAPVRGWTGMSWPITVVFNGGYTGTVVVDDGGAGGTFSPSATLTLADVNSAQVTYTPATAGTITLTATPTGTTPLSLAWPVLQSTAFQRALFAPGMPDLYFPLNEAAGATTVVNYGTTGLIGTVGTGVTLGVAGIPGDLGATGTGMAVANAGQVTTAAPPTGLPTGSSPYTIGCWIKTSAAQAATWAGILGYGTGATNQFVGLYVNQDNKTILVSHYANDMSFILPAAITNGIWHMILATFDGITRTLFWDGRPVASDKPATFNLQYGGNPFRVGAADTWNAKWNGTIDEPFHYNFALTQAQIAAIYLASGLPVPNVRFSQAPVEVLYAAAPNVRFSQAPIELLYAAATNIRFSQAPIELLYAAAANVRFSQAMVEVLYASPQVRSHTTNLSMRGTMLQSHTGDVLPRGTSMLSQVGDLLTRSTVTLAHTSDVLVRGTLMWPHADDVLARSTVVLSHAADALVRSTVVLAHTDDILSRNTVALSHASDVLPRGSAILSHASNILIRGTVDVMHVIDVAALGTTTTGHAGDVIAFVARAHTHATDLRMRGSSGRACMTDIRSVILGMPSHAADMAVAAASGPITPTPPVDPSVTPAPAGRGDSIGYLITGGKSQVGIICWPSQANYFRFRITQSGVYRVVVFGIKGPQDAVPLVLWLNEDDALPQAIVLDERSGPYGNPAITITLAAGDYVARVNHREPSGMARYLIRVIRLEDT